MKVNHIIIGDAHAKPGQNLTRFYQLGELILRNAKSRPDEMWKVIDIGDFEDMNSLSTYSAGTLQGENSRIKDDLDAAVAARCAIQKSLDAWNQKQVFNKKRMLQNVRFFSVGGNHFEGRLERLYNDDPRMIGIIPSPKEVAESCGFSYTPFLEPLILDGIAYVHYWQSRGSGKPIATGKFPAQVLLREKHISTVVGHSHVLDVATAFTGTGKKLFAAAAGCFIGSNDYEEYAKQGNNDWSKGILILENVKDGFPEGGWSWIPVEMFEG